MRSGESESELAGWLHGVPAVSRCTTVGSPLKRGRGKRGEGVRVRGGYGEGEGGGLGLELWGGGRGLLRGISNNNKCT
jgi:hypothetical protein